jgi:tetratricopeptide (TPR) repeat protein
MNARSIVLSLALLAGTGYGSAQETESHHHAEPVEKLGTVSFTTSCGANVHASFKRGVALLHSFWYDEAEKQFKEIAGKDPSCAIAYWGEAMSLYHQLWDRPDKVHLQRGWELLQKAKRTGKKTERERDYIEALAAFYRDYGKVDHDKRAAAYSEGMERVYQRYPDDNEAAVFYALSLLASEPDSDTQLTYRKKAVSILNAVLNKEPDHPGVAHYLIHACDNPKMAWLGLPAARRYAEIAPASPHALHMPSHIFARLGLWQEDIQSNRASKAAAERLGPMHVGMENRLHAMDFLEYAYLQIGEDEKAKAIIAESEGVRAADLDPGFNGYLNYVRAYFPATYALETRHWKDAEALSPPAGAEPMHQAITYWARAVAAGHLRDVADARAAMKQFDAMVVAVKKGRQAYLAKGMETNRDEARAWLAFAEGRNEEALNLLRPVAERQDQVGKGEVELPAREMLADMLLEMNRPQDALAEYETSLKSDPNRFNGLYGAARAAELAHRPEKASAYSAQLLKNCENAASSDRPELAHAKELVTPARAVMNGSLTR